MRLKPSDPIRGGQQAVNIEKSRIRLTLILTALFVAGVPAAASAAPQGPWQLPATDLSETGQSAQLPQIGFAPDGTATAVWYRYNGTNTIIQAKTRPPGGPFGEAVDLSEAGQSAEQPQIGVSPDGTATAVWFRSNGSNLIIQAATRPPGGPFGEAVDLSESGQSAIEPQIGVSPDGTATAVWRRFNGSNLIIQAATRPPGGPFGEAVDLSEAGQSASFPQIGFAPDGTATAVWFRSNGSNNIIQAATRPPGGPFGEAVDLSATGQNASFPQIGFAPDGTATAVWTRSNGSSFIIQAKTRPPGGSFGEAVDLSEAGQSASFPQIGVAPDGTATVVWRRSNGTNNIIQAATRPPGGSFGEAVDLSDTGQNAFDPQIGVAPDGTTTAVWRRYNGSEYIIQARTRPPGGSFGEAVDLSETGQSAIEPQIGVSPDGTATAVWYRSNGTNNIIQSASTAQPSPLLQVNRTGTGSGSVTSTPAGIDCGPDCAENYLSFTKVTLTATPDAGSTFTGWSGAGCSGTGTCEVTMLEATTVTAEFTADPPPPDPPPPAGKPRLANLKVTPKSKKVRRGKKTTFKVRVKNTGNAAAKKLKVCAKGPKKLVKVPKCRKPGKLAAGKSKTVKFKVRVKKRAKKGKKAKLTFTATAKGAKKKSGKATVKIR